MESPSKKETKSPKFLEARDRMPEELRPIYDQIVDEYHYRTCVRFGSGYVAYQVLADLVLMGWRSSATQLPIGDEENPAETPNQ